MINMF